MPCAGLLLEFLLYAQCCFRCGVSLTHPMLASLEFLSYGLGSFSHMVYAGFFM